MGDCRIRFLIAKSLFVDAPLGNENSGEGDKNVISSTKIFSSDTTIREVIEQNVALWELLSRPSSPSSSSSSSSSSSTAPVTLWDCTLNPPKDITSWPLIDYPDLQGPKSLTLHSAHWFPSGTLVCLPPGVAPSHFFRGNNNDNSNGLDPYMDLQYNNIQNKKSSNEDAATGSQVADVAKVATVKFQDATLASTLLPSQVMASVARRFDEEEAKEPSQFDAIELRRQNRQLQVQRQRQRAAKLDQRIAGLEELARDEEEATNRNDEKKKGVSLQVLRMLVKSRATGDDRLKMQDRLYFQCLLLHADADDGSDTRTADSAPSKVYRYFSPQDTFAKIAGSFEVRSNGDKNHAVLFTEVLCRRPTQTEVDNSGDVNEYNNATSFTYRRFPVAMRVYEAMASGYLTDQMDTLIVRWYKHRDDATPAVNEIICDSEERTDENRDDNKDDIINNTVDAPATTGDVKMTDAPTTGEIFLVDAALLEVIQKMDQANDKGKVTKKSSTAATKVHQMKMKSKAKGDAKRIPKMEDRFFMEVVVVENEMVNSGFYFLAQKDQLERILQCAKVSSPGASKTSVHWDFLVPHEDKFQRITDPSTTMKGLEEKVILKPFGRLVLRRKIE